MKFLLGFFRLIGFAISTILIFSFLFITSVFYRNKNKRIERGIRFRRFAIRILHFILGSKIIVYGDEPKQSGLIISNHRSYFDPVVILKNILAYPIAKKEVNSWPIVGQACRASGVIFVDRNNKESRKETVDKIGTILKQGYSILNTPEGTTHIEPKTIEFKSGAFAMAANFKIPVIPVAIDYKYLTDAWIGDDTFVPHFLRCFGKWRTEIKVSYLKPIISNDIDYLIATSKKNIDAELIRFRKDWGN